MLQNTSKKETITSINDLTDPLQIADELNKFFSNIGPELASDIPASPLQLDLAPVQGIPVLELEPLTVEEVTKLIMNISDSKVTGEDEIPVRFLKMTTAEIICHIINRSIITKIVPDSLKITIIMPLYKDGDKNLPSTYRPISVLPVIFEVLERIVHDQG